ncbi:hypothetical protein [Novipirellula caenicola]|uniref:Uncharacterized protein n=1 Tax=Novipirellula caenicola TaxID=1536901 RepID=A0ABP9VMI9_9BACT
MIISKRVISAEGTSDFQCNSPWHFWLPPTIEDICISTTDWHDIP